MTFAERLFRWLAVGFIVAGWPMLLFDHERYDDRIKAVSDTIIASAVAVPIFSVALVYICRATRAKTIYDYALRGLLWAPFVFFVFLVVTRSASSDHEAISLLVVFAATGAIGGAVLFRLFEPKAST